MSEIECEVVCIAVQSRTMHLELLISKFNEAKG